MLLSNLPADLTTFVGRRDELDEVERSLGSSRLVTIMGVGGVGKTRLALRAASEAEQMFPDGVWLVELAALRTEELLAQTIVSALGIRDQSARWDANRLAEKLRSKQMLLVLDNCEHLQQACAETATTLLRKCPSLRILVTSRQALGIAGEHHRTLMPMRYPKERMPPRAMLRYEAVRLLVDRAASTIPGFTVDAANARVVLDLCQKLEGVPLAIELAAAKLRVLSLEQLLRRLEDRFALLRSNDRSALPRHQALRALIDWSFDLCTPQEKTIWARLSVFAHSCEIESVESICAGEDLAENSVFDAVTGLLDKSILAREDADGSVRYRMLETIREYGRAVLRESGEEAHFQRRHRDWYLGLAGQMHRAWFGPDQASWFARMRTEHPNIRVALQFCLDRPDEAVSGMRIAAALGDFWRANGLISEARRWFERFLDCDCEVSPAQLNILNRAGYFALLQGDITAADHMIRESRRLLCEFDSDYHRSLLNIPEGFAAMLRGDIAKGIETCRRFSEGHHGDDDLSWLATCFVLLGMGASVTNRTADAMKYWGELLELSKRRGEQWRRSYALWGLGIEAWRQTELDKARSLEVESIELRSRLFDDHYGTALCTETLAWISTTDRKNHDAAWLFGAAHMLRQQTNAKGSLLTFFNQIHEQCQEQVRKSLGDSAYRRAFEQGRDLVPDGAVVQIVDKASESRRAPGLMAPLTRREWEVAGLIAKGMANREIARTLVISHRTAESHVDHILSKLGFTSRHEISAWMLERLAADRVS